VKQPRTIDAAMRARLSWVRVGDPPPDLTRFPDFLIVGPQRTGTTWLHANLRWHPEIYLSEPKEIFYFSRLKTPDNPRFQSADLGWYLSLFRDPPWRWLVRQAMSLRHHRRPHLPRVIGEATASYAALDEDVITEVATLNPDIRIIMMVRDPVERAWSHAKKDLVRNAGRRFEDVAPEEFRAFFRDPYQIQCARYGENLERWRRHLQDGAVLVARYEDVSERPEELLVEVMDFLGVSSGPRYLGPQVREEVNPAGSGRIPEDYRRDLEEVLAAELASWRESFTTRSTR
jgi:hypothetical protein